jgi:capsular polysaccharide biosynthesis protein
MRNKYMDEEIDLRDYINVLIKWKWLIIWITILSMLISGIASYFIIKPTYRGEANLLLPKVGDSLVLSAKETEALIQSNDFKNFIGQKINLPFESVSSGLTVSSKDSPNFVKINFENNSKDKIEDFFKELPQTLNEDTEDLYNKKIYALKSKLSLLEKQAEEAKKQELSIEETLKQIGKSSGNKSEHFLEYSFMLNTYNSIVRTKMSLENGITSINTQISGSHKFKYIGSPFILNNPVKPKKLFNIAVSGVAAFFFAVLLAFFLEYWTNSDDKQKGGLKKKYEK